VPSMFKISINQYNVNTNEWIIYWQPIHGLYRLVKYPSATNTQLVLMDKISIGNQYMVDLDGQNIYRQPIHGWYIPVKYRLPTNTFMRLIGIVNFPLTTNTQLISMVKISIGNQYTVYLDEGIIYWQPIHGWYRPLKYPLPTITLWGWQR